MEKSAKAVSTTRISRDIASQCPAGQRMAMKVVAVHGVSVALACSTFQISETCYRYSPTLNDENEDIADWLERLATNKRTVRGEWLSQYTFETIEEAQDQATEWLWTYNNERPNMGIGGMTPAMKLKTAV